MGFQELFYDLFVVAALNVFSSETGLANGTEVASYVVFFAAIWAIWASQTVFDVSLVITPRASFFQKETIATRHS